MESMEERIESMALMVAAVSWPSTCVARTRVAIIVGGLVVVSNFTSDPYAYPPGLDGVVINLYSLSLNVFAGASIAQFVAFQPSVMFNG